MAGMKIMNDLAEPTKALKNKQIRNQKYLIRNYGICQGRELLVT